MRVASRLALWLRPVLLLPVLALLLSAPAWAQPVSTPSNPAWGEWRAPASGASAGPLTSIPSNSTHNALGNVSSDAARLSASANPAEPSALASAHCPELPSLEGRSPVALLDQLQVMAPLCLNHAPFHRLRGQALLQQGQPSDAIESLERALLLEPEHPGTQLDYAQALIALGDQRSARQLINALLARADVPDALRPLLAAQAAELSEAAFAGAAPAEPASVWAHRWVISQSLGADNNLNNATRAEQLTLTLPQGNIELPIDQAFRPRSGLAALTGLQWTVLRPNGAALWLLQSELRYRHTADRNLRYSQGESTLNWLQAPDAPSQWVARLSTNQLEWAGNYLYGTLRAGLQRQWAAASTGEAPPGTHEVTDGINGCRHGVGAEWELRRFPTSPALNGHYRGMSYSIHCPSVAAAAAGGTHLGLQTKHWSTQLRLGQDRGNAADRAGGQQVQWEWRSAWAARWGQKQLQAEYVWAGQSDADGFSPILSNNAARRIQRHALRGEVSGPLPSFTFGGTNEPQWFVSLELAAQESNLPAFVTRQTSLFTGLRWTLD